MTDPQPLSQKALEPCRVEQRHRDAAADLAQWLIDAQAEWENMVPWFSADFPAAARKGIWDSHAWVQAFARFEASLTAPINGVEEKAREALRNIEIGTANSLQFFKQRLGDRKKPTWYAVNALQDGLAAACGTAYRALAALRINETAGEGEARNGCEMPEVAAMRYIEKLRAEEGDSVTILCDDPEAWSNDKRLAVECNGGWTNWIDLRFYGESVTQCLAKAVVARDTGDLLGAVPMGVAPDDAGYAYQKTTVGTNATRPLTSAASTVPQDQGASWLIEQARSQADELAAEGINGTPNLLRALADALTQPSSRVLAIEEAAQMAVADWDVLKPHISDAAVAWCGTKDRETDMDDIRYFKANWSQPGLLKLVIAAAIRSLTTNKGGSHG